MPSLPWAQALSVQGPHSPSRRPRLRKQTWRTRPWSCLLQGWPWSHVSHSTPSGEMFPQPAALLLSFTSSIAYIRNLHLTNQPQNPKEHRCSCCASSSLHLKGKTTQENRKGETCKSDRHSLFSKTWILGNVLSALTSGHLHPLPPQPLQT